MATSSIADLRRAFYGSTAEELAALETAVGQGKDFAGLVAGDWGGGTPFPTPDDLPIAPHADNYEFDAISSSLPSGWSWLNQGGATYVEANGAGLITEPGKTTDNWRGIVRAIPSGASWTATVKLSVSGLVVTDSYDCGFLIRESGTGEFQEISHYSHSTFTNMAFYVNRWTGVATYSSSPAGATGVHGRFGATYYMRIRKNSATSYDFSVSPDGLGYFNVLAANDVSTFLTPDQIGVALNSRNNNPAMLAIHWYRVTA